MRFLDGWKTALGILGALTVWLSDPVVLARLPSEWRAVVLGAAAMLVGSIVVVVGITLLAALLPARKASRMEPAQALRTQF